MLTGWRVDASGSQGGPAARAAALLRRLGVAVTFTPGPERLGSVYVADWTGEAAVAASAGLRARPRGRPCAQYLGLLATFNLLGGGGDLNAAEAVGLLTGQGRRSRTERLRCRDGWLIVRWRSAEERALLPADLTCLAVAEAAGIARSLRLLAAPVLEGGRSGWRTLVAGTPATVPNRRLRVVDWSPLVGGPMACAALASTGAEVVRIEHPHRPDGLRRGDPALWRHLNGQKQVLLADAATLQGWRDVAEALRWADLVVSGNSLRVLPQLGFTESWFRERAPRAALIELVAYLPPYEDQPGLGEQASAVAGLLWSKGQTPRPARPWADPLAGALGALLALAWERAGRPAGARLRLSLEGAAGLVL